VNERNPLLARLERVERVLQQVLVKSLALNSNIEEHEADTQHGGDEREKQSVLGARVFKHVAEVEDLLTNQNLHNDHRNGLKAQLDDASLRFETLTLLLMQPKNLLDQSQEEALRIEVPSLSAHKPEKRDNIHNDLQNLNEHKVKWSNEAQKQKPEEHHAIALAANLRWLVHSVVQQHVDNGGVGDQEARAD